jgi:PAS domain S-box-containing protein
VYNEEVDGDGDEELLAWLKGPLADALAASNIAISILVDDGVGDSRMIYSSPTATKIHGFTPEELKNVTALSMVAPEDLPPLIERQRRRRAGEPVEPFLEIRVLHKDGTPVPVELGIAQLKVGKRTVMYTLMRDIRDRKRAEEDLRQSEERYRRLIEEAPESVALIRDGKYVYANRKSEALFGRPVAELIGQPVRRFLVPEDHLTLAARSSRVLAGETMVPAEYRIVRPDGSIVNLEVASIALDHEGAAAILGFARDVTEKKRLEDKLQQAERMATVGRLAAGVAHELNNPLAYLGLILGQVSREAPRLASEPDRLAAVMDLISEARTGVERMTEIVRDLRMFSRDQPRAGVADVRRVLDSAIKMAENEIRHRARLVVDCEALPLVAASEARLAQVFLNLLVNAAQAVPEGDRDRHEIRIEGRAAAGRVILSVSDTGEGIPPEIRARLFEPYVTSKPGVGTGLGMSICHGIVTALGGEIGVESTVGKGTTIRVTLPAAPAGAVASTQGSPPMPPELRAPTRPPRVLIIDDEPSLAQALGRELQENHDITLASSGRRALELLLRVDVEFDAILCDLMMPEMTGMELHEELRRVRPGLEQRIIFMTGGAFTTRARTFLEKATNPHVEKPFDMDQVRALIWRRRQGAGRSA